ncbi:MAG TPA: SPOR domain-containing protein, partial [Polyangiaceae bacterium]|nr:SPOR domain-containing protein [Polyangiaceae bacterium]
PQAEEIVAPSQATFATRLSDQTQPTTALAAVKDDRGDLVPLKVDAPTAPLPPSAVDRLPVVPLPAGNLLKATTVTTAPGDELTTLAVEKSRPELVDTSALSGSEGGYQIQVASFRDQAEADAFVAELKKRGHKSYRQAAYVPDRGLWHRVRIGPFKQKFEAVQYQAGFEQKEHMSTFLVDPEKVAREQQERAARVAARED